MDQHLREVLEGNAQNYILPFFWQHGESRELLEEGMEKIHDSGIGAVCVESRPHPDFVGEGWWRDMDIIMEKARALNMKVWVLDDAHFPSGYCNGKVGADSPYGKTYLTHYTIDVAGPVKGQAFMVKLEPGERLMGVLLSKRDRRESFYQTDVQDVTERVSAGKVYLDIPEGVWAVTVIKTTDKGSGRKGYINPIDKEAVKFFLDAVYEPHFARYGADFGETFAGFFSDEPELGNCLGEYVHDSYIGQPTMSLPWSGELEDELRKIWGGDFVRNLLAMWVNVDAYCMEETLAQQSSQPCGFSDNRPEWAHVPKGWTERQQLTQPKESNRTGLLRRQFMELVSELYGKHFTTQIGDWCRSHGGEYIGHVIEDGGTHSHLGLGTGHFFKALWGQDMSGIDVVLQQIRPQMDDFSFYSIGGKGFYHGEFFHYGLAKMGTSLGHLDPKKKGRTMCEVFGAYGWAEGLKLMKWIMDHMLVRGVNYFVPHAFTMKEFPDPDCPPHFYARGNNPQFPYFKNLMEYTNRVSHLISGGRHVPAVALLYTAKQEWMGPVRKFEKDARELMRGQIDFEVVPEEILLESQVVEGKLLCGEEAMKALVIPGSYCISKALMEKCREFAAQGLPVFVTEQMPLCLLPDGGLQDVGAALAAEESLSDGERAGRGITLVSAENLVSELRERCIQEITPTEYQPWLRYYHYHRPGGEFFLFFTETVTEEISTGLSLPAYDGPEWWYDPWLNRLEPCHREQDGSVKLKLSPYEMKILYQGDVPEEMYDYMKQQNAMGREESVKTMDSLNWTLELGHVTEGEIRWESVEGGLGDISASFEHSEFSGLMRYRTSVTLPAATDMILDLGEVYETAQVKVNGRDAGVRIAPPYRFEIGEFVQPGENSLEIVVANTLVHRLRDHFSMTLPMEPSGLLGPVKIVFS